MTMTSVHRLALVPYAAPADLGLTEYPARLIPEVIASE